MKKFMILLSMIAALVAFNSCNNKQIEQAEKVKQLKKNIEEANKQCPVNMGMIGDAISLKYDEEANEVQLYIAINDDIVSIDALQKSKQNAHQLMKLSYAKEKPAVLRQMIDAGAGMALTFKSNQSGKTYTVSLSLDELKEIKDKFLPESEVDKMLLENKVAIENSDCPYYVDEGREMVKVYDDGENIVYSCRVDEEMYDIARIKAAQSQLKEETKKGLIKDLKTNNDTGLRDELELYYACGKGVVYHYYGDTSGESVDIAFSVEELTDFI